MCYTRLECKKEYSNTLIAYSKWPPKWAEEQDFWAKLGFRKWMITIVKNVSDTNKSSIKTYRVACYSGKKLFEIFVFKTREKSLFCRHFYKHCFSCFSLIPAQCLYFSTIPVAKHSIKIVGLCFLIWFGNKLKDFLINGI